MSITAAIKAVLDTGSGSATANIPKPSAIDNELAVIPGKATAPAPPRRIILIKSFRTLLRYASSIASNNLPLLIKQSLVFCL